MQFNPDPNKQANEVILFCKSNSANFFHLLIKFNHNSIAKCPNQKYLQMVLDSKLNFSFRVDQKIKNKKCNKIIGLIRRLLVNLPWSALLMIYKSFIRLLDPLDHLDYGNILYENQFRIFRTTKKKYYTKHSNNNWCNTKHYKRKRFWWVRFTNN